MRIISLQPSITRTLADLGALDSVIACTKYCREVCEEAAGKPVIHDSWSVTSAEISAIQEELHADLVIASVPYRMESLAEILKAGLPVLALAPKSLADVFTDIALIAKQVDRSELGCRLVSSMQESIGAIREKTSDMPRPTVYCEEWGKPLIHSQHWVAELVEAAGGSFLGVPGTHTTPEEIAHLSPDVIIAAWCGAGDRVPLERIVEQRCWQSLPAVRANRVYCINDEFLNTPASSLIYGLNALAAAIHPEDFVSTGGLRRISRGTL